MSGRPIVIVGLPRSGTTWTMRALGSAAGAATVLEGDNEDKFPATIHAKRALGRYPVLAPGQAARPYRDLWEWILDGAHEDGRSRLARHLLGPGAEQRIHQGRRDPVTWLAATVARSPRTPPAPQTGRGGEDRIVAKSIHAQLAVEWLADQFDVDVLLLLRHPANVLASWMELNLKDSRNSTLETRTDIRRRYLEPWGVQPPGDDPLERMSWRIGLLIAAVEDARSRHPEWQLRTHEQLCVAPTDEFRRLYDDFGLDWGTATEEFLEGHNTPGSGFVVNRVASELPDAWRSRLDADQVATLRRVLDRFPISTYSDEDFAPR